MMDITMLNFNIKGDKNGSLIAIEGGQSIPIEIKRVYYIYGTQPGVVRGHHAHKVLEQVLICVSGECTIVLDDGKERRNIRLDSPALGLYVGPRMWREMKDFSPDAVLLVLASAHYDESDYMRNYQEFLAYIND